MSYFPVVNGSQIRHESAAKIADYIVLATDDTITVDTTAGVVTITLPPISTVRGRRFEIKKINAGTNACVIDGDAAETIDGQASISFSVQYQSYSVQAPLAGTDWLIM